MKSTEIDPEMLGAFPLGTASSFHYFNSLFLKEMAPPSVAKNVNTINEIVPMTNAIMEIPSLSTLPSALIILEEKAKLFPALIGIKYRAFLMTGINCSGILFVISKRVGMSIALMIWVNNMMPIPNKTIRRIGKTM